jgi:hypothetical protein
MFALCSGIVLSGALLGIIAIPKQLYAFCMKEKKQKQNFTFPKQLLNESLAAVTCASAVLYSFGFSLISIAYILIFTALCGYQIAHIAGKIGLALLGRFATFVMVPGLFIFGFTALQATIVSMFVELVGGVATDALFSYKAAELSELDENKMYQYQQFGVLISSIAVAIAFWFLCSHFQLGTEQFFAQRGQARALLLEATSFDYHVVALGVLFGYLLKNIRLSPLLVMGGLLMPPSLSLLLIGGGAVSLMVKDRVEYEPFCSGVYAANALTMLVGALL